jgi:hypothetical protein
MGTDDSFPDDVNTLKAMLRAERAARLAAEAEAQARTLLIEKLKLMIKKLRHEQFGQSSEPGALLDQLELQLADLEDAMPHRPIRPSFLMSMWMSSPGRIPRNPDGPRPLMSIIEPESDFGGREHRIGVGLQFREGTDSDDVNPYREAPSDRLGYVVGDVKNRKRKMIAQLFDEGENLSLRPPIQRRKWLIHQQDFRLGEQGTANAER